MTQVRAARPNDAAAIAAIYAPYVETGIETFELVPPDAETIAARMASAGNLYPWLVAETDGEVVGYAYAGRYRERAAYRWTVETSVYVAKGNERKGIGRTLYAELIAGLKRQGFVQAIGVLSLPNPPSVALHEAMGFVHVGTHEKIGMKFGRWIDVGHWQLELNAPHGNEREPLRLAD